MKKEFNHGVFRQNLELAIEYLQYFKADNENMKFKIETKVCDENVKLTIILNSKIIYVKTFDSGHAASRLDEC